jgi:hypothetical protein
MKKQSNSVYLVAEYLKANKKSYIHDMKRKCKANNVGARIMQLRRSFEWQIDTILEGYNGNIAIWFYKVKKAGKMPKQFIEINKTNG